MTYKEKELDQFLHGISLSLLSKKSAQHWQYDEETAKEIEWLEALERKVRADKADRKTEPQYSEDDMYWLSLAEDVANGKMSDAEANQAWLEYINHKDEPQTMYYPQVDGITPSVIIQDEPSGYNLKPVEDEPQTDVRGSDMASIVVTVIGLTAFTVLVLWLNSKM